MIDKEIVKALECCKEEIPFCTICPCFEWNNENDFCREDLMQNALDLINRQQAEVERLTLEIAGMEPL